MRHLAFYYAVGFAVVGCLMLITNLSTFIGMVTRDFDLFATVVLATGMSLPFLISGLSWRDWKNIQRKKDICKEEGK